MKITSESTGETWEVVGADRGLNDPISIGGGLHPHYELHLLVKIEAMQRSGKTEISGFRIDPEKKILYIL